MSIVFEPDVSVCVSTDAVMLHASLWQTHVCNFTMYTCTYVYIRIIHYYNMYIYTYIVQIAQT